MAAFAVAPSAESVSRTIGQGTKPDPRLPEVADLLDAVGTPLMIVRNRRILLANQAARDLLGDHIEGGDARLAIRHPAAAERLNMAPGTEVEGEIDLVGLGDVDSHWSMTVTRLPPDGSLVRLNDLSAARAVEKMRADFVANASHELRTPLATLLGFLETLEDDEAAADPATRKRFLKIMSEEAARMRNLVEDLMSLSRIEADRFSLPREPVDIPSLLDSVVDACRTMAESRGSQVVVERETEAAVVPGDRAQLAQLFNNLVTNALKYGRAGTPVRIRVEDAGSLLRVRVMDEGDGIAPEHIPRLTERFYRVDPGRSRAGGGTGLGLAIAKHIAQRHRGRLEIVSKPGKGTSVRVYLPRFDPGPALALSSNSHMPVTEDSPSETIGNSDSHEE
ncbi:MAG TPA: ATP-binding protein [Allosphingosinicella sp.]|nr:ATP-binding protein [Allosphingosinicella sp.]